jgi:hypothetical protein
MRWNRAKSVVENIPLILALSLVSLCITGCVGPYQASNPPPPMVTISTPSVPVADVGTSYSTTLTASGGTAPYRWSITAGALPAGLALDAATGAISGTPASAASSSMTVQVKDSSAPAEMALKYFSIVISASVPPPGAVVVTNYGATGNGSTDDTGAINKAIAALQAGGILYFPCGTYLVSAALTPLTFSDLQVLGPPSQCVTIHVKSANNFNALMVTGGISSSVNLAADVTSNTFTLVPGGMAALGLNVGDYVMISDTPVIDNGIGSPPISTREVFQVSGINGDTATINGTFAWMFTMISPHPEQWGGNPFAQKLIPVSNVVIKYIAIDGTGSTGTINPFRFNNAVNSEVGFVNISNFVSNAAFFIGFGSTTGYQNNFHDMTLTNASNGSLPSNEGEAMLFHNQSYLTVNNISITASAGQAVFGFGCHDCSWGTISNVTVDLGGASGRVFKTLRADHNVFNNIVARNGVGFNGINITDVSQFNTFNNCLSTGNDQNGINLFGSYDVGNTFNNCISEFNAGRQFQFGSGFSGQYADDSTTINGGTFCCARGGGAIIQQDGTGFTLNAATVSDDQHQASAGLLLNGTKSTVTNNTFSGFSSGHDIWITSDAGNTFVGNSTPDGTTPNRPVSLF